jgi:hypothetical protein
MDNTAVILYQLPSTAVEVLPDGPRYKCRFKVRSSSSNQLYLISYDDAQGAGYWTCSCRGNIRHGSCKHLEAAGLQGRKYGWSKLESSSVFKKISESKKDKQLLQAVKL